MILEELVNLITTEEIIVWDYSKDDFINNGSPLNENKLDEMNLLECEVLSIESQDDDIVVNIDTSEIGD